MTHRFIALCSALFLTLAAAPALAQSFEARPSITVTGEAHVKAVPDIAILQAGVSAQARTAREAMSASAKAMTAVLAALKESGVADRDIQTSRLRLNPVHEQNRATPVAVEASSILTIQVRDLAKSADLLDRIVSAGANLMSGIGFEVSKQSELLDQARSEAIADAKRKAELYAKAAGIALGAPISITEGHISRPVPVARTMAMRDSVAMPVAPGEEKLGVSVTVSYEIKQ